DLTGTTLADGTYAVNAKVTDTAGNSSEANQDVVIDTTAPNDETGPDGGALPDVAISRITDDTGTLTSDFITNDNTLKIQGQWSQDSGTLSVTVDSNVYVLGTDAALASNGDTWTL
ncbi:Ig-like domain-containing protein, partial [Pseudoalteromonas sp. S3776]|uniref:Ig-like domain-containing protein n=1 Tax=Pseudoalteromonas sp. S3776 TaxID=579544 RepID=UPI00148738CB